MKDLSNEGKVRVSEDSRNFKAAQKSVKSMTTSSNPAKSLDYKRQKLHTCCIRSTNSSIFRPQNRCCCHLINISFEEISAAQNKHEENKKPLATD